MTQRIYVRTIMDYGDLNGSKEQYYEYIVHSKEEENAILDSLTNPITYAYVEHREDIEDA